MSRPEHWILVCRTVMARAQKAIHVALSRLLEKHARPAPITKATSVMIEAGLFAALLILALIIGFAVVLIASE